MNCVVIKRLYLGDYSSSKSSSEALSTIGLFFTDIYPDTAHRLRNELKSNDEIHSGGNCTFIETKGINALISFQLSESDRDAVVNRYSLAAAIDRFHALVAQQVPTIYIIEEDEQLTVTDTPTPEIEEYLKLHKS